jgi:MFS family permease
VTEIAAAPAPRWWALFAVPDYRRLWTVGLVLFVVRWIEMLAFGVIAYERTGSAFLVAMLTMLRLLPMGLFGAFIGAAAERTERRTVLLLTVLAGIASSAALAALALTGILAVWHLAVGAFVNGIGWAADNPGRRVMIGEVAGGANMRTAMSLDVGANTASRMLGPPLGGVLLASTGIGGAFILCVALQLLAVPAVFALRVRNQAHIGPGGHVLARIAEGLAMVRRDARLRGILVVTLCYNLFGWPCTSMVPVIGHDSLQLGPRGVGLLASMDGLGAFFGAIAVGLLVPPRRYARAYVWGCAAYFAALPVFALVPDAGVAGAALLVTGLGGAAFSIMQATLVYLAAPVDMRSRILGVLSVCIGTGPIGFFALGALAEQIGAPYATATAGCTGLLALAATHRSWRTI